jgi:hypothetical protein
VDPRYHRSVSILRIWAPGTIAVLSTVAGCAYPTGITSGGACQRTVQCGPGLVCAPDTVPVAGQPPPPMHCTSDLTNFGMGHPTNLDAGVTDAASDAGVIMYDTNQPDTAVPVDAWVDPNDAFVPGNDAFVPPNDAFVPPNDAFVPPNDAFVPPDDAWVDPNDAWVDPGDAG